MARRDSHRSRWSHSFLQGRCLGFGVALVVATLAVETAVGPAHATTPPAPVPAPTEEPTTAAPTTTCTDRATTCRTDHDGRTDDGRTDDDCWTGSV